MKPFLLIALLLAGSLAFADIKETYRGTARDEAGKTIYTELHNVVLNKDGRALESVTEYGAPDGKLIGRMKSDYRQSLTSPVYTFEDLRDGSSHGVELQGGNYILWRKDKDKTREEKVFSASTFKADALVVGCQGLHYYLVDKLQNLKKEISVKYLIPGKLDYYNFTLKVESEDAESIYMKVRVESVFLRLFVSALSMRYRKSDRRLITYEGLSNIPAANGDLQSVFITYDYAGK